ncbi:MAG: lactate utilization protein [Calditrichaeota bacterium]|nr:MAG: lactate utilization protein [Calditrichota bacterium]
MKLQSEHFRENLPAFLNNRQLRQNLAHATRTVLARRQALVAEIPDWEARRRAAYRKKKALLEDWDRQLAVFAEQAGRRGVQVYRAEDAAQAVALAVEIARRHNVRQVIKSKSMLTEEIGLNEGLAAQGVEVTETDLGEWILQLAGEAPAHLTAPAIHKSTEQIAELFSRKLGRPCPADPQELTRIARDHLRRKFLQAQMGISGANFAIVEEGAIAIVENEANARLTVSLPPVHVAFIGMERLLARRQDLALFLPLLTISSTAQKLTSFVSYLTGPAAADALDGPRHVYFILVDNGRRRMGRDARLRQALYCIRCGACYNACPVYQTIGGQAYGWVYQGPIGAVITPELVGLERAQQLPFASSLCGACSQICPVHIPLHELLLYQRHRIVAAGLTPHPERLAMRLFGWMFQRWDRYSKAFAWLHRLPWQRLAGSWSRTRRLPMLARRAFRQRAHSLFPRNRPQ